MTLLLGLLMLLAPPPDTAAAPPVAGLYRLRGEHDVASELMLRPDGRFDYALAAGALDEEASGRWRLIGGQVRLTTEPKPVPPQFTAGAAAITRAAPLIVHAVSPDGHGIAGIDLEVGFESGAPLADYTHSEDGWRLDPAEHRHPAWVRLGIAMYGLASQRFPIDAARANELTFVLTPNDLGRIDFEDLPLDVAADGLVMHRSGASLLYARERSLDATDGRR